MLILGVDTSGRDGSIALVECGDEKCAPLDLALLEGGTFSAQLIPQIAALLQKHGMSKHQIDAFAVVSGPGSFTGLRVGLAAIKALSEILHKPIAAVSLLEVIASEAIFAAGHLAETEATGRCWVVMEAGRREVYAANYAIGDPLPRLLREELFTYEHLAQLAEELGKGMSILSPDKNLIDLTVSSLSDPFLANFGQVNRPDAVNVAKFGWKKLAAGCTVLPEALDATYIRRSEAEIKLIERNR